MFFTRKKLGVWVFSGTYIINEFGSYRLMPVRADYNFVI